MRYLLGLFSLSFLFVSFVQGQTTNDIEKAFTKTEKPNQFTHNGISITVKFDKDGQICKAVLPSSSYSNNEIAVGGSKIKREELKDIINLLAPSNVRGNKIKPWGLSTLLGQIALTTYEYENVTVTTYWSIFFKREKSSETSILADLDKTSKDKSEMKSNDPSTSDEEFGSPEVAIISWPRRQCDD